jgi:hypothetical protein
MEENWVKWLLGDALVLLRTNRAMLTEIEQGKEISEVAGKHNVISDASNLEPSLAPKWWLEDAFRNMHLSFVQGVLLIYGLLVAPAVFFLPFVLQSAHVDFRLVYLATFVGSIEIFVILIPLSVVNRALRKLSGKIRENLGPRYVTPANLLKCQDLEVYENLKKTDDRFRILYVKPVLLKTLNLGYELSFRKRYQIAAGAIAWAIFVAISLLRSILHLAPPTVLEFPVSLASPMVALTWTIYAFFLNGLIWFLIGITAWSLFVVFLIVMQTSSQTIEIRSFEPIRERLRPITDLVLRTSFAVALLVAWACAFTLVLGMLPPAPLIREITVNSVACMLVTMIPIIGLSLFIPFMTIHKGMVGSRERALIIKRFKLEKLEGNLSADLDTRLKIQSHLISDYRLILENPEWPLGSSQILQVFGTFLLPIITFFVSRLF